MLERMVKSTVIFTDEDQNKKDEKNFHTSTQRKISLSQDDYRQIIKEAYQQGREDAMKEQKQTTPKKKLQTRKYTPQKKKEKQQLQGSITPETEKLSLEEKGKKDAMRVHAKEKQENLQRFKTITARHEIEILRAKSIFPFTLFPDTLIIDTTKVTIASKQLFATEFVTTIPLKDLADVTLQTVLFMGTLMIKYMPQSESPGMTQPIDIRIPNMIREDAVKAKNILKGVLVAKAEEIDIAKLPPEEVVKVLEKFGSNEGIV